MFKKFDGILFSLKSGGLGIAILITALASAVQSAGAQDPVFRTLQLAYGISITVPTHWHALSIEVRKNITASGQASMEIAGLEYPVGGRQTLLAMNATPNPVGAMVRVIVSSPVEYSQSDLSQASDSDLRMLDEETQKLFKTLGNSGGIKVLEMHPSRIEVINNYKALVLSYTRAGMVGPSPWSVTQYKIPVGDNLIELTLSNRQSDSVLWRPILEKIKRSISF